MRSRSFDCVFSKLVTPETHSPIIRGRAALQGVNLLLCNPLSMATATKINNGVSAEANDLFLESPFGAVRLEGLCTLPQGLPLWRGAAALPAEALQPVAHTAPERIRVAVSGGGRFSVLLL